MIVVDGRTDEEKLLELLTAGAEETALDFKSTLDLSGRASKDSLEFAKDAISLGNLPAGGYIVVGVNDKGAPAHDQAAIAVDQFDSADLRQKVARFVDAPVNIISQHHVVEGRDVVLIYVGPNPDGLPVPVSIIGQYMKGDGKSVTVFSEGEVLIREGTSNVRLRYSHWNQLLARYRERIKAEARRDADELVRRVVEGFRGSGPGAALVVPLDPGMDDQTLTEALITLFESGSTVRVQEFLNEAAIRAGAGDTGQRDDRLRALDQIAAIACQAVLYDQHDTFRLAIVALERAYKARLLSPSRVGNLGGDRDRAQHYLDVFIRGLGIGSLAVRRGSWDLLPDLANRAIDEGGYVWTSWFRHALTMASRANLLNGPQGQDRGGQAISLARALVSGAPHLRPDYPAGTDLPREEELTHDDWLLNSLCEFDLWWCILAVAARKGDDSMSAAFYPSCSAFHQWRSHPTLRHIATESHVRAVAFPDASDQVIANSMVTVLDVAIRQSHLYGGWWDGIGADAEVAAFVRQHASEQ
ncbi:ATP-binding protein [uncultured Nocardioides sp.]|uniref:AlbA family DNA-binding domain-containing protein n=1 Tax=uncultured Nocardioides sp. TaxID=198441 RepID=UPI0026209B84|nr:ATP-binding protein [uncultured Nocardioides sp.]